ncbi:glutathione S-transferase family protein [Dyella tabacisoli]|uniref:Glutathione S-transferase family protein n=1 Tax=Dyella tabacisoli TaxID=2282381 RepID=A0A369UH45_9GAMM|nr:glutathione S-transferase family protein [Dyella tabacisoli]RDD79866.1 glutathione S-transferase family protein [Dyella tabacisoli]
MKLYYAETLNPRKSCAVAKYLGSPVEFVRIALEHGEHLKPEYLAKNPNGKVPLLVDGDLILWESAAIMTHLAVKAGSNLWPSDGAQQVEVMRWLSWDLAHFSRHGGALYFENYVKPAIRMGETDAAVVAEATKFFKRFAGILDEHLADRRYLVADQLSLADFAVASVLPWAKEAKLPLEGFTHIVRWHDRMMELPAWREPFPTPLSAAA